MAVVGQVLEPNFSDADFLAKAGCATAGEFISRKFFAGETQAIADAIIRASGFDRDIAEDIEAAKN